MNSPSNGRSGAAYEATVNHLRTVLRGFSPKFDNRQLTDPAYRFKVPAGSLPTAVLAREVMVVFGAVELGRQDKEAWKYGFTVDGSPCTLASTKYGLRLHLDSAVGDESAAELLADRVLGRLAAAQKVVNKSVLAPQLDEQIRAGNVTITNQYALLRGGYDYHRERAEQAYSGHGHLSGRTTLADLIGGQGSQEGWWNTLAMVTSYFSTIEHVLIGSLPFTSFDPAAESLVNVIGAKWNEKLKKVVDMNASEPQLQYAALRDIAERFRNTYSHGAFGAQGKAAMFVHIPDVGAVPVTLGEFGVRPELHLVPAVKDDFDAICAVFDAFDRWLESGPIADGYRWVVSGLDYRFDADFRAEASAARRDGRFEQFVEETDYYVDRLLNMEF